MTNNQEKTVRKSNTSKIVIWVAIIGLAGTLGAALFANWDKLFPSDHSSDKLPSNTPEMPKLNQKVEVQELASEWMSSLMNGDIETVVKLSGEQFYFNERVFLTKTEFRSWLNVQYEEGNVSSSNEHISSIEVQTIRELKEQGTDLTKDQIFSSQNLTLDDYAISVNTSNGHFSILIVRKSRGGFEIVGILS